MGIDAHRRLLVFRLLWLAGVAWSSDSRYAAAGSSNGTVCVLPVRALGAEPLHLEGHSAGVLVLAWSPRGGETLLASGGADAAVRVWTLRYYDDRPAQLRLVGVRVGLEHTHDVASLAWSPAGLLASGSKDASVLVYEVPEGDGLPPLVRRDSLEGHTGKVSALSWSQDGTQLASSSLDSTVRVWELPASPGGKAPVWALPEQCIWSRWIWSSTTTTTRLACARRSPEGQVEPPAEEPPYTYYLHYMLVDFQQQLRLLRRMTYGDLDGDDLNKLGLLDIRDSALAPTHRGQMCLPAREVEPAGCVV